MELRGRDVTLRPATSDDAPELAVILAEPSVAAWWPKYDLGRISTELETAKVDDIDRYVIELDGRIIGYIQASEETEPEFRHAGIDLFLTTDHQGRGLGPDAIRTLAAYLVDEGGHHRLTIDPAADNGRAIAAYAKIGFRPIGRLRRYQRTADWSWIDGFLMEMLAEELIR